MASALGLIKDVFMEIERPEFGPLAAHHGAVFPTIGAFYDAVSTAIGALPAGDISAGKQITKSDGGEISVTVMNTAQEMQAAIGVIKEQGEGTSSSPLGDPSPSSERPDPADNLAHYYKFAEIYHGHRLVIDNNNEISYSGTPLPLPATFHMAEVPPGGYPDDVVRDFDHTYEAVLTGLQNTWDSGDSTKLGPAVGAMFKMQEQAQNLMQQPRPDGQGNYGPDFRILAAA